MSEYFRIISLAVKALKSHLKLTFKNDFFEFKGLWAYVVCVWTWTTELLLTFKKEKTRNELQIWVYCQSSDFHLHKNLLSKVTTTIKK